MKFSKGTLSIIAVAAAISFTVVEAGSYGKPYTPTGKEAAGRSGYDQQVVEEQIGKECDYKNGRCNKNAYGRPYTPTANEQNKKVTYDQQVVEEQIGQ